MRSLATPPAAALAACTMLASLPFCDRQAMPLIASPGRAPLAGRMFQASPPGGLLPSLQRDCANTGPGAGAPFAPFGTGWG